MSIIHANVENFENEVLKNEKKVILDFYADWCGPCRMMAPIVHQIASEHPEILVGKINVDEETDLASQFGVESIPTLVVMKDGEIINQAAGAMPKAQVMQLIPM